MKSGLFFCDSDMHVFEPGDLYQRYMDEKWGDRIPRAKPRTEGTSYVDAWAFLHDFTDAQGQPIRRARYTQQLLGLQNQATRERNGEVAWRFEYGFEHNFDSASQVVAMDREGCDVAVLFRTYPLILDDTLEPEYALAVARAWNDWMTEFCRYAPERLKAACLIPLHDVDLAVDEVRRVKQLGHIAVCLTPEPHNGRHIHDAYYDPLWAELEKLDLAATFHPSQRPNLENVTNRFPGHPNASTLAKTYQNNLDEMMGLGSLILGGVLERFPRLRVAMLEGNCGWVPWLLYRMDDCWEQLGRWATVPLSMKPSDYFLRQCWVSVDAEERLVGDLVRRIGDDNIVFSTDYPHQDSKYPQATDLILRTLSAEELGETTVRKILWDNCARLYKIPKLTTPFVEQPGQRQPAVAARPPS